MRCRPAAALLPRSHPWSPQPLRLSDLLSLTGLPAPHFQQRKDPQRHPRPKKPLLLRLPDRSDPGRKLRFQYNPVRSHLLRRLRHRLCWQVRPLKAPRHFRQVLPHPLRLSACLLTTHHPAPRPAGRPQPDPGQRFPQSLPDHPARARPPESDHWYPGPCRSPAPLPHGQPADSASQSHPTAPSVPVH